MVIPRMTSRETIRGEAAGLWCAAMWLLIGTLTVADCLPELSGRGGFQAYSGNIAHISGQIAISGLWRGLAARYKTINIPRERFLYGPDASGCRMIPASDGGLARGHISR
jgi:hypothetical protein